MRRTEAFALVEISCFLFVLFFCVLVASKCNNTCNLHVFKMAVLRCSAMFLTWLLFMTVLISSKGNRGLDKKVCSIVVVKGLDVNHYPTRNSGPTRRYVRVAVLPPALKCLAALRLLNITLCASYLMLLAGDIQQNPGPAKNYSCPKRRRDGPVPDKRLNAAHAQKL